MFLKRLSTCMLACRTLCRYILSHWTYLMIFLVRKLALWASTHTVSALGFWTNLPPHWKSNNKIYIGFNESSIQTQTYPEPIQTSKKRFPKIVTGWKPFRHLAVPLCFHKEYRPEILGNSPMFFSVFQCFILPNHFLFLNVDQNILRILNTIFHFYHTFIILVVSGEYNFCKTTDCWKQKRKTKFKQTKS